MSRALLLLPLLALSAPAFAEQCEFSAHHDLSDDLGGVHHVRFEIHSHDAEISGSPSAHGLSLTGLACASSQQGLNGLTVQKHREGDTLVIEVGGPDSFSLGLFGASYRTLHINVTMATDVPVELNTGSGDAHVRGVAELQASVGSGDLDISDVPGAVTVRTGSGDINLNGIGSLRASSVGSGDLRAHDIAHDVQIGSVGSGDVGLHHVGGSVNVGTLGSGDLTVTDVTGNLTVGAKGSGDLVQHDVHGQVRVPHDADDD